MPTKLKVQKVRDGSFQGRDGEEVEYYWTKGLRVADGVTIEFGGKVKFIEGEEIEITLEKTEQAGGTYRYKQV